jgi:hypothetical protein
LRTSAPLILIRILATAATAELKVRPSACALARWPSFVAFVILLSTTITSFPLLHKILQLASPFPVPPDCRYFPVLRAVVPCPALACHVWVRVRVHVLIFRRLFRSRIDFAVGPGNEFRASPIHLRTGLEPFRPRYFILSLKSRALFCFPPSFPSASQLPHRNRCARFLTVAAIKLQTLTSNHHRATLFSYLTLLLSSALQKRLEAASL